MWGRRCGVGCGQPDARRDCAYARGCCTRSVGNAPVLIGCSVPQEVQRPVTGAVPGVGVAARTVVELVTPKRCAILGSVALVEGAMH